MLGVVWKVGVEPVFFYQSICKPKKLDSQGTDNDRFHKSSDNRKQDGAVLRVVNKEENDATYLDK